MAQNVKKMASKDLKKPKVAENSKSCQNSKKLPKISKVAEKLPSFAEQLVAKPTARAYKPPSYSPSTCKLKIASGYKPPTPAPRN